MTTAIKPTVSLDAALAARLGEDLPPLEAAVRVLETFAGWNPDQAAHDAYHTSMRVLFFYRAQLLEIATIVACRELLAALPPDAQPPPIVRRRETAR